MKKSIFALIIMCFLSPVRAEQIFQFCNTCYSTSDVDTAAELYSLALNPGNHSVVIVNDNTNKVWNVIVRVSGGSFGNSFPVIGDNSVEILSTDYLADESIALAMLKDLVDEPFVVDTRLAPGHVQGLIESLCPVAHNGSCTALNNHLYNLPRTLLYRQYRSTTNLFKLLWRRLFGDDLIMVVIFLDGSIGVYQYNGSLSVNSIVAVDNTATNDDGEITNIGGYLGLDDDDFNVPGNSNIPYGGSGGSGDCTVAITSVDNEVFRVTVTCE
ncbi:hypothetical protein [Marinicella sp. W31]|uniref:hypothetical protein n=1 Tax=Marinicella sp. W31 TaxID=3023713 RepID=UPI003757510F